MDFGLLDGRCLIDPKVLAHLLTILPGDLGQAVSHYVDNAQLRLSPRINILYGLWKAVQAVLAGDEDIVDVQG